MPDADKKETNDACKTDEIWYRGIGEFEAKNAEGEYLSWPLFCQCRDAGCREYLCKDIAVQTFHLTARLWK